MKRFLICLIPCFALTVFAGCGGGTENSVVEVEESPEDTAYAEKVEEEYDSAEYAKEMKKMN